MEIQLAAITKHGGLFSHFLVSYESQHTHSRDSCGMQIWGWWEDISFNPRHLESVDWIILKAQIALKGKTISVPPTRKLLFEYLLKCDPKEGISDVKQLSEAEFTIS